MTKLRLEERKGRTNAEKLLREKSKEIVKNNNENSNNNQINLRVIGLFHSPYNNRRGTPRQGILVPSAIGYIEFSSWIQPQSTLDGLIENFSHIWVIWQFHENTNSIQQHLLSNKKTLLGCKAKIKPPRLNGKKIGIFACRTPHRPNPIGLTKCKIIKMDYKLNRLYLSDIDMINGTPIIDIKPYIPYSDITMNAIIPKWCTMTKDDLLFDNIIWDKNKENKIIQLLKDNEYFTQYFDHLNDFKSMIEEILIRDIRSLYQRNKSNQNGMDKVFECKICDMTIKYMICDQTKTVTIIDAFQD